uniref:Rab GTPasebinding effector protein 1like [Aplysia californica] n=1 Tax=Lepeophtheirus salmonis TaxID=72036 RepID=A0A0K2SVX9_LEPSM
MHSILQEETALALEREKEALSIESKTLKTLLDESKDENDRIRAELDSKGLGLSSSTLSDVTKSFARKVKSNLQTVIPKESPGSMLKAQEDTELLKSIVIPLEEQIHVLKDKLRHTDTLLRELEARHTRVILAVPSLTSWLNGKEISQVSEALKKTNKSPETSEGETFEALMDVRYGLLLTERNELRQLYDKECDSSSKLRKELMESNHTILRIKSGKSEESSNDPETGGPKMVSCTEWNRVLNEVRSNDVSVDDLKNQLTEYKKLNEKYKEDLMNESIFRKEVESKWNDSAELHKSETDALSISVRNAENILEKLKSSYSMVYETTRRDLHLLSGDREKLVRDIRRLQEENDKLIGKHRLKAQEFENQVIELPDKIEDIHTLLLKYREDLISAKIAKETLEEKMKGEVSFLKAQIKSEQQVKESMEESLTSEIEDLKGKNQSLDSFRMEFEAERRRRQEMEGKNADFEELKRLNFKITKEKSEFQSRISNLQKELDNSVAVQTDFVRLSQSLQMELEKIRQSEKEVRWQHEDDVSSCSNCSNSFGSNKHKHNCRHCGKVFCIECLSKTVPSGPSCRESHVCNVCYTLLVSDSAPYFSIDVPTQK